MMHRLSNSFLRRPRRGKERLIERGHGPQVLEHRRGVRRLRRL